MLRTALEIIAVVGYTITIIYHGMDMTSIPIPVVGLAWLASIRCIPPAVDPIALFWVTYAFLVYQLVCFHDLNACLLHECDTTFIVSCITLGSTVIFWISMKDTSPTKYKLDKKVLVEPALNQPEPSIKIRVNTMKPSGPIRLRMVDPLQPRWV